MKLLADNILVKIIERQSTNSGIIIQDDETSLHYAVVKSTGDYINNDRINIDNVVAFPKLIARRFKYDNEEFAIITENDIILVFDSIKDVK